jgi:streptogramin lyase
VKLSSLMLVAAALALVSSATGASGPLSPARAEAGIVQRSPDGSAWRQYVLGSNLGSLDGIVSDPSGRYEWIANYSGQAMMRLDIGTGAVTSFPMTVQVQGTPWPYTPGELIFWTDGRIYMTGYALVNGFVTCGTTAMTTSGTTQFYQSPSGECGAGGLTVGPDGAIWYPEFDYLARLDPSSGTVTESHYPASSQDVGPTEITTGPDGNLWFTQNGFYGNSTIDKAVPATMAITQYAPDFACANLEGIAVGGDRKLHTICARPRKAAVALVDVSGRSEMRRTEFFDTSGTCVTAPDGSVLFSTTHAGGGLVRIDARTHRLSFLPSPYGAANYLSVGPNHTIWGLGYYTIVSYHYP